MPSNVSNSAAWSVAILDGALWGFGVIPEWGAAIIAAILIAVVAVVRTTDRGNAAR
jgi:hypothetical protein